MILRHIVGKIEMKEDASASLTSWTSLCGQKIHEARADIKAIKEKLGSLEVSRYLICAGFRSEV